MTGLFDISGKVAVVTGGSRGIGRMITEGLLRAGVRVHITARKADQLHAAADEMSSLGEVVATPADLSDEGEVTRFAGVVADHEPAVHILVNNAGASWGAPVGDFPAAGFDKVLGVNVTAPFLLTQALLPQLRAAASHEDPARVVNIGSIDGLRVPMMDNFSYSASKAAVHMLTRHLAHKLHGDHITVNAVAPGPFESKMTEFFLGDEDARDAVAEQVPLGRIGRADDMAGVVQFLASRAGSYLTGAVIPVDGGISTR